MRGRGKGLGDGEGEDGHRVVERRAAGEQRVDRDTELLEARLVCVVAEELDHLVERRQGPQLEHTANRGDGSAVGEGHHVTALLELAQRHAHDGTDLGARA